MIKVTVIGSGNVARHLIKVFDAATGISLNQAYSRSPANLAAILPPEKITGDFSGLVDSDVYIIAVTDGAINEVASSLPFSGKLVVHTSGSVALQQLDNKNRRGVFYPLQTFSKNKAVNFKEVPLCLEAESADDLQLLERLAAAVSDNVYHINSEQRQSLHVAAVFVSNFANHMYALGNEICSDNNVPFDILKPLIKETADKVQHLNPVDAQTGPARRNDVATMHKHVDFLKDEDLKTIYRTLSLSIQNYNEQKL